MNSVIQPKLSIHTFKAQIAEETAHFMVVKMLDSVLIWVGEDGTMNDLTLAMIVAGGGPAALSNQILGDHSNLVGKRLASKLAQKTAKRVFTSYNFKVNTPQLSLQVLKRIIEEINTNPSKF